MNKDKLELTYEELSEVLNYSSRTLVGKVLKRYEIFGDLNDKNYIKKALKELIYEEYRHLTELLYASGKGLKITQFNLKSKG